MGRNRAEVLLLILDFVLLTLVILVPNPFHQTDWPLEMQYRFGGHTYFYIYLALGTLAFSWRTVRGIGSMAAIVWLVGCRGNLVAVVRPPKQRFAAWSPGRFSLDGEHY